MNFILEGRASAEGRVVDARTGKPIPEFEIARYGGRVGARNNLMDNDQFTAYYDEGGYFTLNSLEAGDNTLIVRAKGYAPTYYHLNDVQGDSVEGNIEIRMQGGAAIDGLVTGAQGYAIQGAKVYLTQHLSEWEEQQMPHQTSDTEGRFRFGSLGEEATHITVKHADYATKTMPVAIQPGKTTRVDGVLTQGGEVEGTVYVNGKPQSGITVHAYSLGGGSRKDGQTDENGFYSLTGLPDGNAQVSAMLNANDSNSHQAHQVTLQGGFVTTVDFEFTQGNSVIQGIVTLDGEAITEGQVGAMLADATVAGFSNNNTQIQAGGQYEISGLIAGNYSLNVGVRVGEGYQQKMLQVAIGDNQTLTQDIEINSGNRVLGVVNGIGEAVRTSIALIRGSHNITEVSQDIFMDLRAQMAGGGMVQPDGTYDIPSIENGTYTILVIGMDGGDMENARFTTAPVTVNGSDVTLDLTLP